VNLELYKDNMSNAKYIINLIQNIFRFYDPILLSAVIYWILLICYNFIFSSKKEDLKLISWIALYNENCLLY
jgi:hypothetical protein